MNKYRHAVLALVGVLVLFTSGCSIRYSPNGGALDYTQLKTITIGEVINKAPIVNPILAANFTEKIKDYYESRTRLSLVPQAGDLELNCTITGYDLTPMAVSQDNFAERSSPSPCRSSTSTASMRRRALTAASRPTVTSHEANPSSRCRTTYCVRLRTTSSSRFTTLR